MDVFVPCLSMLKNLARVSVEFCAFDPRVTSAREFLARAQGRAARGSNPKCEVQSVQHLETSSRPPVVRVTFEDGNQAEFLTAELSVSGIVAAIGNFSKRQDIGKVVAAFEKANPGYLDASRAWEVRAPERLTPGVVRKYINPEVP